MLEPPTQTVVRNGHPVKVTATEFRRLLALVRRHGAIASRAERLREVWGPNATVHRRVVTRTSRGYAASWKTTRPIRGTF